MFALISNTTVTVMNRKTAEMMAFDRTPTGERYNGYEAVIYIAG